MPGQLRAVLTDNFPATKHRQSAFLHGLEKNSRARERNFSGKSPAEHDGEAEISSRKRAGALSAWDRERCDKHAEKEDPSVDQIHASQAQPPPFI